MDIYFVRHGQTDGNLARRHQHSDTKLNELGKQQAVAAAARLRLLEPNYLFSSTYIRAIETARIIGQVCGLLPETYPVFTELKRPDTLIGERFVGKVTMFYLIRWFFGVKSAAMHDGEGYREFLSRIAAARRQIEALPPDSRVVVVSHAVFIKFFVVYSCHPGELGFWRAAWLLIKILTLRNAAITHLRYTPDASRWGRHWRVVHHL